MSAGMTMAAAKIPGFDDNSEEEEEEDTEPPPPLIEVVGDKVGAISFKFDGTLTLGLPIPSDGSTTELVMGHPLDTQIE